MRRRKFRFIGHWGGRYYWEAPVCGGSRVEQISCDSAWFWSAGGKR